MCHKTAVEYRIRIDFLVVSNVKYRIRIDLLVGERGGYDRLTTHM